MRFSSGRAGFVVLLGLASACDGPVEFVSEDTGRVRRDAPEVPVDAITVRPEEPVLPEVDVEVTLPFGAAASVPIEIAVSFAELDLVLNIDTTGSFDEEINQLQNSFISDILPALRERVDGIAIGVTKFQDYDFGGHGGVGDVPYLRLSSITTDFSMTSAAIARLDNPIGLGGDLPESGYEALYQIATGAGHEAFGTEFVRPWSSTMRAPGGGTEPGVGFREHSVRAVIHATDAESHDASDYGIEGHSLTQTLNALVAREIHVIGVVTENERAARAQLETLALTTGAVVPPNARGQCLTGIRGSARDPVDGICPLVFDVDARGAGLNDVVVQSIEDLLRSVTYQEAHGIAEDDRYGLVHAIAAVDARVTPPSRTPRRTDEFPVDGVLDTFREIDHGVTLNFEVQLRNDVLMPDDYDRRVTLTVVILGDGLAVATRTIRVLIPRRVPTDAGPRDAALNFDAPQSHDTGVDAAPDAPLEEDASSVDAAVEDDAHTEDASFDAAD